MKRRKKRYCVHENTNEANPLRWDVFDTLGRDGGNELAAAFTYKSHAQDYARRLNRTRK